MFKRVLLLAVVLTLGCGTAFAVGAIARQPGPQTHWTGASGQPTTSPISGPPASTTGVAGEPTQQPSDTEPPKPELRIAPGAKGDRVRELQSRLHQIAWLPETVSGVYDEDTRAAVAGFQTKRGLRSTGVVDQRTWNRLERMTEQPTHDAMFNVFHPGPALLKSGAEGDDVRDLQARLKTIAWYFGDVTGTYDAATVKAIKGFQAKRQIPVTGEVDQRTLDRLHSMTYQPTHEAMFNIEPSPGALDPRCETGRVLCIDKTSRTLRFLVDGTVLQTLDARFGSTINDTPTREGLFHVQSMDADHVSNLYGSSMPFAMFFSGGQAVHYSSDFATYGYGGASHGCVNIRDYDGIQWLFSQVRVGDKVVVYWS
jgi:peptidoglycan hydrolase-like protein with peptidoglycan-binding domain